MTRFIQAQWAAAAFAGSLLLMPAATHAQGKSKAAHAEHGQPGKDPKDPHAARDNAKPDQRPAPAMHAAASGEQGEKHAAAPASDAPRGREGAAERSAKGGAEPASDDDTSERGPATAKAAWADALDHARNVAKRERASHKAHGKAKQKSGAESETQAEPQAESERERAHKHRQALQQRFAGLGKDKREPLAQELRHHAHRTAKLARIRAIAESKGDKQTLARVDRLAERELARHEAKVARLSGPANSEPASAKPEKDQAPGAAAKENAP